MSFRPTVRLRLTLLYGCLFLLAGAVLLAVNYALVRRGLEDQVQPFAVELAEPAPFPAPGTIEVARPGLLVTSEGRPVEDVLEEFQVKLRDDALHELLVQSSLGLGLMSLVSIGLGWLVAGRALRPLQEVTATARRLSDANLHERLAMQGPDDELKELADTFDAMLERLETAFDSQRTFVANASHELRTPLAVQRALVDVTLADPNASDEDLRNMAVAVRDAVDRSERLIDGLLVLARSQQGPLSREPVDLATIAAVAIEQSTAEAVQAEVRVDSRLGAATVDGNRPLLERLMGNLVDNAIRHNHAGGWLEVRTASTGGIATVDVRNSGPLVEAARVPELFEPFRRLTPDRVGSQRGLGLGLSIVRAVAAAHGGTVTAQPLEDGGLQVTVTLPTVPAAASDEQHDGGHRREVAARTGGQSAEVEVEVRRDVRL